MVESEAGELDRADIQTAAALIKYLLPPYQARVLLAKDLPQPLAALVKPANAVEIMGHMS